MKWALVITAADGTVSVAGPYSSEYHATVAGNQIETTESGLTADVHMMESPQSVISSVKENASK